MVSLPKLVIGSVCSQTYDSWCKSPNCILLTRWFLARPSRVIMKLSSRLCSRNGLRPGDAMSLALPNAEWKWKRLFSIQLRAISQKYSTCQCKYLCETLSVIENQMTSSIQQEIGNGWYFILSIIQDFNWVLMPRNLSWLNYEGLLIKWSWKRSEKFASTKQQ